MGRGDAASQFQIGLFHIPVQVGIVQVQHGIIGLFIAATTSLPVTFHCNPGIFISDYFFKSF
jgi:hypothetical protein